MIDTIKAVPKDIERPAWWPTFEASLHKRLAQHMNISSSSMLAKLQSKMQQQVEVLTDHQQTATQAVSDWLAENIPDNDYVCCIINGVICPSLSRLPELSLAGWQVTSLSAALQTTAVAQQFQDFNSQPVQPPLSQHFSDSCYLGFQSGCFIDLPAQVSSRHPLHVVHWCDQRLPSTVINTPVWLRIGQGASLNLNQWIVGDVATPSTLNIQGYSQLAKDATLTQQTIQMASESLNVVLAQQVLQQANSIYDRLDWLLSGCVSFTGHHVRLLGEASSCHVRGVLALDGHQVSMPVHVLHEAEQTTSHQQFCGLARKKAHGIVESRVVVAPSGHQAQATQSARGVLLDASAYLQMQPELEIETDDVQCQHGASIGALDPAGINYLRARGLSTQQAQALMMEGLVRQLLPMQPTETQLKLLATAMQIW